MKDDTIARRYARALMELGKADGNYRKYGEELHSVDELIKANRELYIFFNNPMFSRKERMGVIKDLFGSLQLSPVMKNFLSLLVDKDRMGAMEGITQEFRRMCDELANIARARIIAAAALDAGTLATLKQKLGKLTGKNIEVEVQVDPSLIGGVVAQVGNEVFDGSIKTGLERIKQNLMKE